MYYLEFYSLATKDWQIIEVSKSWQGLTKAKEKLTEKGIKTRIVKSKGKGIYGSK